MILDRKSPPPVLFSKSFEFLKAETENLQNGIPLHYIDYAEQDILRLQFVFNAGSVFQQKNLVASSVNSLITEGTATKTAKEIADYIEGRGVFIETESSADTSIISIYCLVNELEGVLPLVVELMNEASFPEQEVEDYLKNKQQKFNVNAQKVGFVARNEFSNLLFGKGHPYSTKIDATDFENISRNDLVHFFEQHYTKGKMEIYAAGKVTAAVKQLINNYIGSLERKEIDSEIAIPSNSDTPKELLIDKTDALQTALRIGKEIIPKSHPDFPALFFLNTVLGGYFGSRLMTNIREDKGYTYGISSGLMTYKKAAYFAIATEVGAATTAQTLEEIKKELELLSSSLIAEKELNLVKNYLIGSIMRSFDGAFSAMDRFRSIRTLGLDYGYYVNLIDQMSNIDAQLLRDTAEKYLQYDSMKTILVGKL